MGVGDAVRVLLGKDNQEQRMFNEQMSVEQQKVAAGLASGYDDAAYMQRQQQQNDLVRWQQDLDDVIDVVRRKLRCERFNAETGGWEAQLTNELDELGNLIVHIDPVTGESYYNRVKVKPMLNEAGIAQVEAALYPFTSKDLLNSNFDDDAIQMTAIKSANNLVMALCCHHVEFQLRHASDLFTINDVITVFIEASLMSCKHDGWRRHIRSHTKELRSFHEGSAGPKKADSGIKSLLMGGS